MVFNDLDAYQNKSIKELESKEDIKAGILSIDKKIEKLTVNTDERLKTLAATAEKRIQIIEIKIKNITNLDMDS